MAQVLAVVADLMLASRVSESLRAAGHEVTVGSTLPSAVQVDAIVCDLDAVDAEEVLAAKLPTLGFYSHVDVDAKHAAEAAGMGMVVPRSRMARELPQLVERLLSTP